MITIISGMPKPNRVGSSLIRYFCIIIKAHYSKCLIESITCRYSNTLICKCLNEYINIYNLQIDNQWKDKSYKKINLGDDHCGSGHGNKSCIPSLLLKTTIDIKEDLNSYFKNNIYPDIIKIFNNYTLNYKLCYNPEKTICLHLILDDVTNEKDYDGSTSFNFFKEKINNDNTNWCWNSGDYEEYFKSNNKPIIGRGKSTYQSPIPYPRIIELLNDLKHDYQNHEIIIIASPKGGDIPLPYRTIRSEDPDLDLFYMINSDVLICSRSTFSLTASFLHKGTKIIFPKWGYTGSMGIESKYDKNLRKLYI
jgi:hypothetical protein